MNITDLLTESAILEEIGRRLARERIGKSLTQAELAEQAGISKRTVERIESGMSSQLSNLIRVLRVLGLLSALDNALPDADTRPMDLLRRKGKERKRVSKRGVRETGAEWRWDDDT
jgi:transcriptional regulator with XRE-family HTH domain